MTTHKKLQRAPSLDFMVLDRHMDDAMKNHSGRCMVAEALKENYPHLKNVKVDIHFIRFADAKKEERYLIPTPQTIGAYLYLWDDGKRPQEFRVHTKGGQTSRIRPTPPRTPEDKAAAKARLDALHEKRKLEQTTIAERDGVAYKLGGKMLPLSEFHKRTFGMKAFAKHLAEVEARQEKQT
jgi:hypothetical protein